MTKQTKIPGVETSKVPEINKAAIVYAEKRDERMELTNEEVEAKNKLLAAMKKHKLETYTYGRIKVSMVHGQDNVKVRIEAEAGD